MSYSVKSQVTVFLSFLSTLKNIQMAKIGINILTNTQDYRSLLTEISLICYNQVSMNLAVNARVTIHHQMKDHIYKFHVGSV